MFGPLGLGHIQGPIIKDGSILLLMPNIKEKKSKRDQLYAHFTIAIHIFTPHQI